MTGTTNIEIITISQLESAINFWRGRRPSEGDERKLSKEVDALADVYGHMIAMGSTTYRRQEMTDAQRAAFNSWESAGVSP